MSFLRSFLMAFSMFSRLPTPTLRWHKDNMRYMLAMFPFVGLAVGVLVWAWLWLCRVLGFGALLQAAGLTLIPVAVTGGIHLDGFCDTADALASRAPAERRREILKDPHAGAFAIISTVCYLILYFALSAQLRIDPAAPLRLHLMFVLSRAVSGLLVLLLPGSGDTGLAATSRQSADKRISIAVLSGFLLLSAAGLLIAGAAAGAAMAAAALLCAAYMAVMSRRQFGGMSGDLAGFFLQVCEVSMLAALVLVQAIGALA